MIRPHMQGWLYSVKDKHEHDSGLHDGLNALDTASHCDTAGCRISGGQILPYEGLCQVEQMLDFILVESKTRKQYINHSYSRELDKIWLKTLHKIQWVKEGWVGRNNLRYGTCGPKLLFYRNRHQDVVKRRNVCAEFGAHYLEQLSCSKLKVIPIKSHTTFSTNKRFWKRKKNYLDRLCQNSPFAGCLPPQASYLLDHKFLTSNCPQNLTPTAPESSNKCTVTLSHSWLK